MDERCAEAMGRSLADKTWSAIEYYLLRLDASVTANREASGT